MNQASKGCYEYLKTEYLKKEVFRNTEKLTRFSVGDDMLNKICQATLEWQQKNFEDIIHTVVLQELEMEFEFSKETFDWIQKKLQTMKIDFDTKGVFLNAFYEALQYTAAGFFLSAMAAMFFVNPLIPMGVFAVYAMAGVGIVSDPCVLKDYEKFRNDEYEKILKQIGENEIAGKFRSLYAKPFKILLNNFFDKEFEESHAELEERIQKNHLFDQKVEVLTELKSKMLEYNERLNEFARQK